MKSNIRCESKKTNPIIDHALLLLTAGFIACILLGVVGYILYFSENDMPMDVWLMLYSIMQLFTIEANLDFGDHVPWPLVIARICAPAVLFLTAWKAFIELMHDDIRKEIVSMFWRKHIVICGAGTRGFNLVKNIYKKNPKSRVIVIEPDTDNDNLATCKRLGALVINGKANDLTVLNKVKLHVAESLYVFTPDDGVNADIALKAKKITSNCRNMPAPLQCYLAISDILYMEQARTKGIIDSDSNFTCTILNINALSARELFRKHNLDGSGIAPESKETAHLVVVGFGNMGENVALQAARIGQFANSKQVHITIVDREAQRKLNLINQLLPHIKDCAAWEACDINVESSQFIEYLHEYISRTGSLRHIAVCLNDETLSLHTGLRIVREFKNNEFSVYLRQENEEGDSIVLDTFIKDKSLHIFGSLRKLCDQDMLSDRKYEQLIKRFHEEYSMHIMKEEEKTKENTKEKAKKWHELSYDLQESNRYQADQLGIKKRALEAYKPGKSLEEIVKNLVPDELEIFADMEHRRWMSERFIAGWTWAEVTNKPEKLNENLVSYAELPNDIQEYDRIFIRFIPEAVMILEERQDKQ